MENCRGPACLPHVWNPTPSPPLLLPGQYSDQGDLFSVPGQLGNYFWGHYLHQIKAVCHVFRNFRIVASAHNLSLQATCEAHAIAPHGDDPSRQRFVIRKLRNFPMRSEKRVQDLRPGIQKIARVARNHREGVSFSDCCDLAVEAGNLMACSIAPRHHLTPNVGGTCRECKNPPLHAVADGSEPPAQFCFPGAIGQPLDPSSQLANANGGRIDLPLVFPKPRHHVCIWTALCGFAQNIRINQKVHSSSGGEESSERSGTSNGEGQEASRSTNPLFAGFETRRSVRAFSSSTKTSKSSPGDSSSCWRMARGRTTWPFWDKTVVMVRKSYSHRGRKSTINPYNRSLPTNQ